MATAQVILSLLSIFSCSLLLPLCPCEGQSLKSCGFDRMYQVGDSTSDTGNLIRESALGASTPFARLPYGETFFKTATGRCSNGLLMIDYFARAAGLPFLNPYKKSGADFNHGVNFAVAGATALPVEFLASKNISTLITNSSLSVQRMWMNTHFRSICRNYINRDCAKKLNNSVFIVGEIGGNDYSFALFQGKSMEEVNSLVPSVVQAVTDFVRGLIDYGAVRVVVPGLFPVGCFPVFLTRFKTNISAAYDEHLCLKQLNALSINHNTKLQEAIEELKNDFPNVVIVYGDSYNAFQWLFKNAPSLGFDAISTQKSCCGLGGDYKFTPTKMCGSLEIPVCPKPNHYISWDGIHLTQQAHKILVGWLIHDILPKLQCNV